MSHISLPSVRIAPLGTGGAPADEVISSTRAGSFSSLTVTGTTTLGQVQFAGVRFAERGGDYHILSDGAGARALYLGGTSDPGNYYDNSAHYFRPRGGGTVSVVISDQLLVGTTSAGSATAGGIRATGTSQFDTFILHANGECLAGADGGGFYFGTGFTPVALPISIGSPSTTIINLGTQVRITDRLLVGTNDPGSAATGGIRATGTSQFDGGIFAAGLPTSAPASGGLWVDTANGNVIKRA
jgi:nucleoside diphosphate kinase